MLIGHQPKPFLLAVEGLTVSFDGFKAVNNLSFYVEENEIRVIIGPNGAGKTTVLDLICGKTKATSGSIQFRGKELTKLKENQIVQTGVGRKFQTPSVFPADKKESAEKKEEPKKRGFGIGSLMPSGGGEQKNAQVAASGGTRGVDPEKDAKGGPNPKPVPVKISAADMTAFKKEGGLS